jgi:osmotically-inducible protein OsmY
VAALAAAHRVAGVRDVANEIRVHLPGSLECTDTDIARAVRRALESYEIVPDRQIRSTVAQGWVTLEGDVGTWLEREAAERAMHTVPGVRGVISKILVTPRDVPSDFGQRPRASN